MLTKNVAVTVKATAADDATLTDGQFTALASVFNNVDDVGDVVLPGAFTDDLAAWKASGDVIPLYWSHRMDDPQMCIGRITDAQETDAGLQVKAELDVADNKNAATVYRLLKGRRVNRMSFAYDVQDGGLAERDGRQVYELRKLKVHEVSVVQVPANPQAVVTDVKRRRRKQAGDDAELAGLVGQADQAIDDAMSAINEADSALDAILDYLGIPDTGEEGDTSGGQATARKQGRTLNAKNEKTLRSVLDKISAASTDIKSVLDSIDGGDDSSNDGKASPTQSAATEEPDRAKVGEPARSSPASVRLRTTLTALAAGIDLAD